MRNQPETGIGLREGKRKIGGPPVRRKKGEKLYLRNVAPNQKTTGQKSYRECPYGSNPNASEARTPAR